MAFVDNVKNFVRGMRGLFRQSFMSSVTEVMKSSNISSSEMLNRIELWLNMYSGNADWINEDNQTLGLPAIISSEMARMVTLEAEVNVGGSPMVALHTERVD